MQKQLYKNSRRKADSVPDTAQLTLLDAGSPAAKSAPPSAGFEDFENPNPDNIFIGNQKLREYLNENGFAWVVKLRELLRGSDLRPFISGYTGMGRKAFHPLIMLGLIVYGIIDGKKSLRELEMLAKRDVGAWWLCGGTLPDHSTIGKFINRFRELLSDEYFVSLTRYLVKELKISSGDAAGDGTVLEAMASRYRVIKAEAARAEAEAARNQAEHNPLDEAAQTQAASAERIAEIAEARQAKAATNRSDPDKIQLSKTDPESTLQPLKNGASRFSYKPSVLASKERLIVGQYVDASDENAAVKPMLDQHKAIFGALPNRALFDAGYHNETVLGLAVELDLDMLCPSGRADRGEWGKRSRNGKFRKNEFRYDEERDVYVCPAKRELVRGRRHVRDGRARVEYVCKNCAGCEFHDRCTDAERGRTIERYEVDELKEAMTKVFENEGARKIYGQRKAMVEPVFSELRGVQNLDRFHRRGIENVRVEFSLHCIAYNLRRSIILGIGETIGGIFRSNDGETCFQVLYIRLDALIISFR